MMKRNTMIVAILAIALVCLTGCAQAPIGAPPAANTPSATAAPTPAPTPIIAEILPSGGVLLVKVNPEIAVEYDEGGLVTGISARNDAAMAIIASCSGLIGQPTRDAVSTLVIAIGDAGYFVEDVEGQPRQITLEIEAGSALPSRTFLDDIADDVRAQVSAQQWRSPVAVVGTTDYGITDYADTDYGPGNDGDTNYAGDTDYGPDHDGVTDYGTDYGPNGDGITDYFDSDYGAGGDGVTDYRSVSVSGTRGDSGYGASSYGSSNYGGSTGGRSNYGSTNYGNSNYGNTNYGNSNYGNSNYGDSDYGD